MSKLCEDFERTSTFVEIKRRPSFVDRILSIGTVTQRNQLQVIPFAIQIQRRSRAPSNIYDEAFFAKIATSSH